MQRSGNFGIVKLNEAEVGTWWRVLLLPHFALAFGVLVGKQTWHCDLRGTTPLTASGGLTNSWLPSCNLRVMAQNHSNDIWTQMGYVPPRGACQHKQSLISQSCPCLRFMVHPLKVLDFWHILEIYFFNLFRSLARLAAMGAVIMHPFTWWTINQKKK